MNPYKKLDVPIDATDDEIKESYHDMAKANHPDVGGDAEEFKEISNAYAILKCPNKRRRYDSGDESEGNPQSNAIFIINELVSSLLDSCDSEDIIYVDIVGSMRKKITQSIKKVNIEIKQLDSEVKKFEKMGKVFQARLKSKQAKNNLFMLALNEKRRQAEKALNIHKKSKEVFSAAAKLLKEYEFTFDEKPKDESRASFYSLATGF